MIYIWYILFKTFWNTIQTTIGISDYFQIFYFQGIGSFFQKSEKQNEDKSGESSSNQTSCKETENDKVINLDGEENEKTENTSDKENEQQTNSLNTSKDVNENELPSSKSKKPSGKQKACVSGKALNSGASSSKKKRRVVLEDSSDEEWAWFFVYNWIVWLWSAFVWFIKNYSLYSFYKFTLCIWFDEGFDFEVELYCIV